MTTTQIGTKVQVLSTNGTGRVTFTGTVAAITASGLVIARANGRKVFVNRSLVRAA